MILKQGNLKKQQLEVRGEKSELHPRNKHRGDYPLDAFIVVCPELEKHLILTPDGRKSIRFADPQAVKLLNKALLHFFYKVEWWELMPGALCPPIPGRADYIHYLADLLAKSNSGVIPTGPQVRCLDIGVGANCVYPLVGQAEYGWTFVGSDIDPKSVDWAKHIVSANSHLTSDIEIRLQSNPKNIFKGLIQPTDRFDLTLCNPPFYMSEEEARQTSQRKVSNLKLKGNPALRNFGGQHNELWCEGGEGWFVAETIRQSVEFASQCKWFTTLVSKGSNLKMIEEKLQKAGVAAYQMILMGQGQKISRIVAWRF